MQLNLDHVAVFPENSKEFLLEEFSSLFRVWIECKSPAKIQFDLVGIPTCFANAVRRIMLSEVPTMAIEHVFVLNNTSVVADELLAQRLGLVPICAPTKDFKFRKASETPTDQDTLVFKLQVDHPKGSTERVKKVYSGDLTWDPKGDQAERFKEGQIRVVNRKILLCKLAQQQELDMELHCEKGTGRIHAKWSPVGPGFYRLMPDIILTREISGDAAMRFQKLFPPGVIKIEKNKKGQKLAKVDDVRKYTMDREVLRHDEFRDAVKLQHKKDHFLFSIECVNGQDPAELFLESVLLLKQKCELVRIQLPKKKKYS